ncbi:MAG: hypothetical protein HYR50_08675 [Candidatus Rokubacteria bacterium]|nr:hypothetical protein [Candidatus Rokubacteria bacterium]
MDRRARHVLLCALVLLFLAPAVMAATGSGATPAGETGGPAYRSAFGASSRVVVWVVAELHLMFGAFVLGVPIFASIVEVVGWRTRERRYDDLAHEFTRLLSAAFSTTAAFGGLFAFVLYPRFMAVLTGIFHETFYVYAMLFFAAVKFLGARSEADRAH